ncbi:MAG: carbamoyl-phosphate synthase large subunit [Salibacteraceae bacterium]|jgi:carbamoyl-phosphate synthase large subunit
MNILINGVGGPTPRSIARTIKRLSIYKDAKLFGTDINPLAYGLYESDLYEKTFIIPAAGKEGYWEAIEKIIKENNIDFAIVQPEHEVLEWTRYRESGNYWPTEAFLPNFKLAQLLVDKSEMTEILKDTDLVPPSINIDPESTNYNEIEQALGYPFWIRSTSGSSGLGSLKVEDRLSFQNWITINPHVKQFIGSQFLPGRNLACKLLYHNGKLVRAASGERVHYIMAKTAPSGITGNTSFGRLLNEPELVERSKLAMEKLFTAAECKPHGFFTADFKEDENGKPYITEINVRMVAFNYTFAVGGANFTEDIITLMTNPEAFDTNYKMYEFKPGTIFLRDVDAEPKLMNEKDLKS